MRSRLRGTGASVAQEGVGGDGGGWVRAEDRRRLEEAQERVVAALVAGAPVPEGFDADRFRVQAASLVAKRRSVVARLRPDAARAAGADLRAEFAAYTAARATPPKGYREDADAFATWLEERGRLPKGSGRLEERGRLRKGSGRLEERGRLPKGSRWVEERGALAMWFRGWQDLLPWRRETS
ncbi:hypothetical protein ACIBEJ_31455 [Nonomuraea sp. NPDC050790]|uniref:hypothetical protein n=1 Tax=Nonomuraea sp. NPDC050790 TaxID=3364371 RepID=UPI0037903F7F